MVLKTIWKSNKGEIQAALKWVDVKGMCCEDEKTDKEKFIKELGHMKAKAQEEINFMKGINHDNILKIYSFEWLTESDLIMITELARCDLRDACRDIDRGKACSWFLQICKAMEYLHAMKIIHRDIKPANILVTDDEKIILSDLGGAKLQTKFKILVKNTKTDFGGTKKYLAPELRENESDDNQFTKESDIWALGIVYHQMLARYENPIKHNKLNISNSISLQFDREVIEECLKTKPSDRIKIEALVKKLQDGVKLQHAPQITLQDLKLDYEEINYEDYIMFEAIGKGEFGIVYKAFHKANKIFVALKFIELNYEDALEAQIEYQILEEISQIKNEKIIKYYGAYKDTKTLKNNKKIFLIFSTEIGVVDLKRLLKLRGKYKEEEIFSILVEVCEVLMILKKNFICHGDVKTADIVLIEHGEEIIYKLVDYGLSFKVKGSENKARGMTPLYASPELNKYCIQGLVEYNPYQNDVYAIAIVALKMMGLTNDQVRDFQISNDLNEERKKEYNDLFPLILRMLERNHTKRITIEKLNEILKKKKSEKPYEILFLENILNERISNSTNIHLEKYAKLFIQLENYKMAKKYIDYAKKNKNKENIKRIAMWYELSGDIEMKKNNNQEALDMYTIAKKILEENNEKGNIEKLVEKIEVLNKN